MGCLIGITREMVVRGNNRVQATASRTVLAEPVYEALKGRIMDQKLRPGARINIDGLAAEMGVSQTPIREALKQLATERLATASPFRGYSVVPLPTQRQLAELMHVRRLLEVEAGRQAVVRATLADLRRLERELEAMAKLTPGPTFRDFRPFSQHDRAFHEHLITAADNQVLLEVYRSLNVHVQTGRLYYNRGEVDYAEALVEHRGIYEALRNRDVDVLTAAIVTHIDGAERRLGEFLEPVADARAKAIAIAAERLVHVHKVRSR